MAYSAPSPADLKARYPAFAAVSDAMVQVWLDDAAAFAGETWPDADRRAGVMAYAAHRMAELGIGTGNIPAGVVSFRSGSFSANVSDAAASRAGLTATIYGREFSALRRRIFGGPRMAWTPPA
ncbi:DUF4054 domain-containing protein [Novosphingobium olei]|uniref:DUF4054 domain-containing protein n=1 Tax=Novosphingobium olei TaxID=2728851 RepID=UPI00308CA223|nr:DUF4054 domain-containing protein [Novosphingobium olei]